MRTWWWISFVDPRRPEGKQFLGVLMLDCDGNFVEAIKLAWHLRLNPGGEAQGICRMCKLPEEFQRWYCRRLLTRDEVRAANDEMKLILPPVAMA